MKIAKCLALPFLAGALACALASPTQALDYPTRPVRLVVGFAPGGPTDILARHMAQYLSVKLAQQFVVENKPGATGNIATEYVMGQPADGTTFLVTTTANAINMTFLPKLTTNFMRDMEPVAGLASFTYMMLVNPGVPAKSVPEFIAYAKTNPGKINFASGGVGSSNQLAVELFKSMTGTDLVHVPYRGNAAAYSDLIGGNIHLIFADLASGRPHAESGALRALGVTSARRLATLPDVPAIAETVPGYEADGWYGFAAPKGTPADVVAKLNAAINAGLADPELAARFAQLEARPLVFTPQQYGAFLASEVERWGKAVKAAGVRGD
jgi:tripartite-type tricarboxylate transporter receptor subunit TctC